MLKYTAKDNTVQFTVSRKTYPLEVVFGACRNFIEKCYVFLDQPEKGSIQVSLKGKDELTAEGLENLAGEFNDELLNQSLRKKTNQQDNKIRGDVVSHAQCSAEPRQEEAAGVEDVDEALELEDAFQDDPLQIAVPWDEKYAKKPDSKAKE